MWKNAGIISHSGVVGSCHLLMEAVMVTGECRNTPAESRPQWCRQVGQWQPLKDHVQIHPHLLDQFHIIPPLKTGFQSCTKTRSIKKLKAFCGSLQSVCQECARHSTHTYSILATSRDDRWCPWRSPRPGLGHQSAAGWLGQKHAHKWSAGGQFAGLWQWSSCSYLKSSTVDSRLGSFPLHLPWALACISSLWRLLLKYVACG